MENIDELILETKSDDSSADAAVWQLTAIGLKAVPQIVNAIRVNQGAVWRLCSVLKQISDPNLVPMLIPLLQDPKADLVIAAFEVLGLSGDRRALQPLLTQLDTGHETLAAEALGNLGDSAAIPNLLRATLRTIEKPEFNAIFSGQVHSVPPDVDESPLRYLPTAIIALARLGNDDLAEMLIPLTHYASDDPYSDAGVIRSSAVEGLQHVVAPGMFAALQRALSDEEDECRLNAVDALFYLGIKEVIAELAGCDRDPLSAFSQRVGLRLRDLSGVDFGSDSPHERTSTWWNKHASEYSERICYRLGHSIYLPEVMELLTDSRQRGAVLAELRIITGARFGVHRDESGAEGDGLLRQAEVWLRENSGKFEPGGLYKYGRQQSFDRVYKALRDDPDVRL